ncbi:unnamed protein product, partial [marine sediment metagenome]
MTSHMPCDEGRFQLIQEKMDTQITDCGGEENMSRQKLIIKGEPQLCPVFRFKLSDLLFNKANGRITSEVLEKEDEMGRPLVPGTAEDEKVIREILFSIRTNENTKIRDDLITHGQMTPGIVTCDGVVINGNRRKAILEQLF